MALIKCSECGKDVSDKAVSCLHCGCPINETESQTYVAKAVKPQPSTQRRGRGWLYTIITVLLLAAVGVGVWAFSVSDKEKLVEITPSFIESVHRYDQLREFSEGMAAVRKGDKWGYINTKGEEVISCQYEQARGFSDGLAAVKDDGKWGYISTNGQWAVKPQYEVVSDFSGGIACTSHQWPYGEYAEAEKVTFINTKGEDVSALSNRFNLQAGGDDSDNEPLIESYENGLFFVADDNSNPMWIDKDGNRVSDENIYQKKNDKYVIFRNDEGEMGFKDINGNIIVPAKYSYLSNTSYYDKDLGGDLMEYPSFSNGVALVRISVYVPDTDAADVIIFGYVDENGNDTFTEADRKRIEEAKEEIRREQERREKERIEQERLEQERAAAAKIFDELLPLETELKKLKRSAESYYNEVQTQRRYGGGANPGTIYGFQRNLKNQKEICERAIEICRRYNRQDLISDYQDEIQRINNFYNVLSSIY